MATSIQYSMASASTAMPTNSADANSIMTEMRSTVRLGNRSAATPPHGVTRSIETPKANITPPSPALLPVRSLASQPRPTAWAITPKITAEAL